MAGSALATAYIQLIPSLEGSESTIKEELGKETAGAGESIGESICSKIKKAIVAAGIGKALVSTIKTAVNEGAALEQSIGGIETLFGQAGLSLEEYAKRMGTTTDQVRDKYEALGRSERTMLEYAKQAYKNAGMSANEYMETATSFAASLVSSLGGDTETAAETANMAMQDMSDNANKMGSDMESLQNAYQGFAKQNYTMLDNLKLGYGGTKEEMERLLEEAEKLSGVHYDIDNLNDVYKAIHVIQDNLGITGTTADEAARTFTGSFAAMKAAAQNLMGYMANEKLWPDVLPAIQNLMEAASTFLFDNAIPMISNFILFLPTALGLGINEIAKRIKDAGMGGIQDWLNEFIINTEGLFFSIGNLIVTVATWIWEHRGEFLEVGKACIQSFVDGIAQNIALPDELYEKLPGMLEGAIKAFGFLKLGSMISKTMQPIFSIFGESGIIGKIIRPMGAAFSTAGGGFAGIKAALGTIISPVAAVGAAIGVLVAAFMDLWNTNEEFRAKITEIWNGIKESVGSFCDKIVERINSLGFEFEDITELLSALWDGFCEILAPVFEGAFALIGQILDSSLDILINLFDIFRALFEGDWNGLWYNVQALFETIWNYMCSVLEIVLDTLKDLANVFLGWFGTDWGTVWNQVSTFFQDIWIGMVAFFQPILDKMSGLFTWFAQLFTGDWKGLWNGTSSFLSDIWDGMVSCVQDAWDGIISWLQRTGINIINAITDPFRKAYNTAVDLYNSMNDLWGGEDAGHWNALQYNSGHVGSAGNSMFHAAGGIFSQATLIPALDGNHVVGEAGAEAILPLGEFYRNLDQSIQNGQRSTSQDTDRLIRKLEELAVRVENAVDIKIDGRSVAKSVDRNLQRLAVAR